MGERDAQHQLDLTPYFLDLLGGAYVVVIATFDTQLDARDATMVNLEPLPTIMNAEVPGPEVSWGLGPALAVPHRPL